MSSLPCHLPSMALDGSQPQVQGAENLGLTKGIKYFLK
jgi:hypothetical protein